MPNQFFAHDNVPGQRCIQAAVTPFGKTIVLLDGAYALQERPMARLPGDNYLGRSGTVAVGRRVSDLVSSPAHAVRCGQARRRSQLMWAAADVIGLFSLNVVSFSNNVGPSALIFSVNVVPKPPM